MNNLEKITWPNYLALAEQSYPSTTDKLFFLRARLKNVEMPEIFSQDHFSKHRLDLITIANYVEGLKKIQNFCTDCILQNNSQDEIESAITLDLQISSNFHGACLKAKRVINKYKEIEINKFVTLLFADLTRKAIDLKRTEATKKLKEEFLEWLRTSEQKIEKFSLAIFQAKLKHELNPGDRKNQGLPYLRDIPEHLEAEWSEIIEQYINPIDKLKIIALNSDGIVTSRHWDQRYSEIKNAVQTVESGQTPSFSRPSSYYPDATSRFSSYELPSPLYAAMANVSLEDELPLVDFLGNINESLVAEWAKKPKYPELHAPSRDKLVQLHYLKELIKLHKVFTDKCAQMKAGENPLADSAAWLGVKLDNVKLDPTQKKAIQNIEMEIENRLLKAIGKAFQTQHEAVVAKHLEMFDIKFQEHKENSKVKELRAKVEKMLEKEVKSYQNLKNMGSLCNAVELSSSIHEVFLKKFYSNIISQKQIDDAFIKEWTEKADQELECVIQ